MPTRPVQGGSVNTWGNELNAWLDVAHNIDGTVKAPLRLLADTLDTGGQINLYNITQTKSASGGTAYYRPAVFHWIDNVMRWQAPAVDVGDSIGTGTGSRNGGSNTGFGDMVLAYRRDPVDSLQSEDIIYIVDERNARIGFHDNAPTTNYSFIGTRASTDIARINDGVSSRAVWALRFEQAGTNRGGFYTDQTGGAQGTLSLVLAANRVPQETLDVAGLAQALAFKPVNNYSAYRASIDNPNIYSTGGGGTDPFDVSGNLIIQPRTSSTNKVVIATGNGTPAARLTIDYQGNVGVGTTSFGTGGGVFAIGNTGSVPSTNPSSAAIIYCESSEPKIRNYLGTIGYLAPGDSFVADTYSASITPEANAGKVHKITVTNATAFTINAPTNPAAGKRLEFDILNSSGGAMGAITWNAAFKMAGAFTNPASTKRRTISFYYDGSNWVELSRAAADI